MKHMKKNDGYVLVYVLVVFTVLSFAAVSICTMALKNLQAQQADVARMEARYEAEGHLQRFLAETQALAAEGTGDPSLDPAAARDASLDSMEADFLEKVRALESGQLTVQDASAPERLVVQAVSADDTVQMDVVLALDLDYDISGGQVPESDPAQYIYTCTLTKAAVLRYESYDISYGEVPDETQ